jgi:Icc-related predicted phosphoesterase
MKVQLASDLHLEFLEMKFPNERLIAPAADADVLVLAGDIATGTRAVELFAQWPVPVLYIAGNHEPYGHDYGELRRTLKAKAAGISVLFMDDDSVELQGVRFLAATLWTDYMLGEPAVPQRVAMIHAHQALNDHRLIGFNGKRFRPGDALNEHERSRAWLKAQLSVPHNGPTVVVIHHGPHPRSVHPQYTGDPLNGSFVSDLSELLKASTLWLHGHVPTVLTTPSRVVAWWQIPWDIRPIRVRRTPFATSPSRTRSSCGIACSK